MNKKDLAQMTGSGFLAIFVPIIVLFNLLSTNASFACNNTQILSAPVCEGDGLEPEERRLYLLVNQYRAQNGLPPIPLSPSLTLVANRHVRDLDANIGMATHAWSNCYYNANDSRTWPCMWQAPQRLGTPYPGNGYENAFWVSGGYRASAESALRWWQSSHPHNAVILNRGSWGQAWNALGVGIYKGYAALWFGREIDPASSAFSQPSYRDDSVPNWNASGLVFTLVNKTSVDLREFYASPPEVDSWEEDILGSSILGAGHSVQIRITDGRRTCIYDLKGVFTDGDEVEQRNVNLCDLDTFYFTER